MSMNVIGWLAALVILIIIELLTLGLTTIWFAGGALIALIATLFGVGVPIQIVLFLSTSIALLIVTRPLAVKRFNVNREKTNVESLIGKTALVTEEIDTLRAFGRVKVNDIEWSAKTEDPTGKIPMDAIVIIKAIQGVKLIVEQKEDE